MAEYLYVRVTILACCSLSEFNITYLNPENYPYFSWIHLDVIKVLKYSEKYVSQFASKVSSTQYLDILRSGDMYRIIIVVHVGKDLVRPHISVLS